uniref:ATP synthase F0 subunit 6 n=1 Tax=Tigrigobius multifasciatus TaxID=203335 RepID=UPI0028FCDC25
LALDLFSQFASPTYYGVPLIVLALLFPWLALPNPSIQWLSSRPLTLQAWSFDNFNHQIFNPINVPGHKWALLLTSLLVYLASLNILGLLPYTFTPTTQLSMSLGLAFPFWLATVLIGFRNQPTAAAGHLLPEGTPILLIPVLIIIETISLFIRPLALGVRLTANLTAGHLLMQLISTAAFVMMNMMPALAILTFLVLILLTVLEVAVAMIQGYVFVLLISLYLQENV